MVRFSPSPLYLMGRAAYKGSYGPPNGKMSLPRGGNKLETPQLPDFTSVDIPAVIFL